MIVFTELFFVFLNIVNTVKIFVNCLLPSLVLIVEKDIVFQFVLLPSPGTSARPVEISASPSDSSPKRN